MTYNLFDLFNSIFFSLSSSDMFTIILLFFMLGMTVEIVSTRLKYILKDDITSYHTSAGEFVYWFVIACYLGNYLLTK